MNLLKSSLIGCLAFGMAAAALAAPEVYTIDSAHTFPTFETSHAGRSYWRGRFDRTSGRIWLDHKAGTGRLEIVVDTTSVSFGLPIMDKMARGATILNVDKYPTATYRSASFSFKNGAPFDVNGELTLLGVTRPLKMHVTLFKCVRSAMLKREICGADVHTEFDRTWFGMTRDLVPKEEDPDPQNPNVRLAIQVEAIQGDNLPQMPPLPKS